MAGRELMGAITVMTTLVTRQRERCRPPSQASALKSGAFVSTAEMHPPSNEGHLRAVLLKLSHSSTPDDRTEPTQSLRA